MATPRSSSTVADIADARRTMYRQQIVAAAEYEFSQTGFTDARMSEIAKTAGVSLATVYKHFAGKDDIWDALNAERMQEFVSAVHARTETVESPLEAILVGVRAEVEFFAAHPHFLQLHINEGLSWASPSGDAGRGGQRAAWRTGMEMITRAAEAAVKAGEITGLRPEIAGALVISALQVWLTDWVTRGKVTPIEAVADAVVRHLHISLGATPT
ncbi:TetR/AcrR family transcriptional regulator [Mycolicibacterium sp. jd]|uniref:TetR/AcrR family transcriptional regulator n=1 Tax=Mycolicibacterium austroafricanum TaxID=39687 RepID=A0ABT8HEJ1_MYCAO|nr:TetR/AcrR family transcriptional regulator [Mycolicibacterium austroafricanum]MDN4519188.1 TetR/AcrR family transcriptional regulator [Mycolicibacterium austroafricanum]